jgi:hypothetical protein
MNQPFEQEIQDSAKRSLGRTQTPIAQRFLVFLFFDCGYLAPHRVARVVI